MCAIFIPVPLPFPHSLLKDVSKILNAVKKCQVELKSNNAQLKAQLGRMAEKLAFRDAELAALKTQALLQNNGGMFYMLL